MVIDRQRTVWFAWCFILTAFTEGPTASPIKRSPSAGFSSYTLAQPVLHHARTKRQINTTRHEEGAHHPEVTMAIRINGEEYVMDLHLRQNLVSPNFFKAFQRDNETVYYKPKKEELYGCEYSGQVRGVRGGWAALATCRGVRGVLHTGDRLLYIEPAQEDTIDSPHYVYFHSDLNTELGTDCEEDLNTLVKRNKRNANDWRTTERYVELLFIVDSRENRARGPDVGERLRNIVHIAYSLLDKLNIQLHFLGIYSWDTEDQMTMSSDSYTTLQNFKRYNLGLREYHDAGFLITNNLFDNILGKAFLNGMCGSKSVGVVDDRHVEGVTANVLAHELGHLLGMQHDEDVHCADKGIMSKTLLKLERTSWSSCSIAAFEDFIAGGRDTCLGNNPTYLYTKPMSSSEYWNRLYDYY